MLKELESLKDQLELTRDNLREAIAGLNDTQVREPIPGGDWSIKDVVAHIAGNEWLLTTILMAAVKDEPSPIPPDFDNERFNAETVEKARSKSMGEIWAELEASRLRLIEFLDTVTPQELARCGRHPLQGDLSVKEFMVVMYAHEETHCREVIQQARRLKKAATRT